MKFIIGKCLCRKVSFKIFNEFRKSVICHCSMCQKSNGEFSCYTKVKLDNFKLLSRVTLKWFISSKFYKRGFCSHCGSSLFFQKIKDPNDIAISTGSLEVSIPIIGHIYHNNKKSKIDIGNKLKKFQKSSNGYFDNMLEKIK